MNVAIIGSRVGVSEDFVYETLTSLFMQEFINVGDTIISGGASGVDSFAEEWVMSWRGNGTHFDFEAIKPKSFDRLCLLRRDREIVDRADKLVAFKARSSKTHGTDYTYSLALKKGIPTKIFYG